MNEMKLYPDTGFKMIALEVPAQARHLSVFTSERGINSLFLSNLKVRARDGTRVFRFSKQVAFNTALTWLPQLCDIHVQ